MGFINDNLKNLTVTGSEVTDIIKGLSINKAHGVDGISVYMLKEFVDQLVPSLTLLFNVSLFTGKLPSEWKKANVSPIHKSGDKNIINN